jgi:small subunit ribosomal protein S20
MPVLESSRKALRRDQRRTVVNKKIKENLKEVLKKTRQKPTSKNLAEAARFLDRAAKKKIIHQNKANRLKSRLSKLAKTKKN